MSLYIHPGVVGLHVEKEKQRNFAKSVFNQELCSSRGKRVLILNKKRNLRRIYVDYTLLAPHRRRKRREKIIGLDLSLY